jgi:hypothetical protein
MISFLSSTKRCGGDTTPAIDTTGATLLVALGLQWDITTITITDSKGNTWHNLNIKGSGPILYSGYGRIAYAYDHGGSALSVGTNHSFKVNTNGYQSLVVAAFSGTLPSGDPFDTQNGDSNLSPSYSLASGSVTPSTTGDLIISGMFDGYSTDADATNDKSLLIAGSAHNGNDMSGTMGYLITSNTNAVNVTWTNNINTRYGAVIATFKQGLAKEYTGYGTLTTSGNTYTVGTITATLFSTNAESTTDLSDW